MDYLQNIVGDREGQFLSIFLTELFRLVGTKLLLSTSYHAQTDRQMNIVNKWLEDYLWNYVLAQQWTWIKWMHLEQYCYNTTYHISIGMAPFKQIYIYAPLSFFDMVLGDNNAPRARDWLSKGQDILRFLKENLQRVQNQQKIYVDRHQIERIFEVGGLVYLKIKLYKQSSLKQKGKEKFKPCFYGPYWVAHRIDEVAYEMELLEGSHIHNIFHVSCLMKFVGQNITVTTNLPLLNKVGKIFHFRNGEQY